MGTRGFVGIKENGEIRGRYNHYDNYYIGIGRDVVNKYFEKGADILTLSDEPIHDGDDLFLYDGLYCEFGYVHNRDNDTLEIYRGFFRNPQFTKKCFITSYEQKKYYTHLIFVVDKKIHTKKDVLMAMEMYDKSAEEGSTIEGDYPERLIINMCEGCFLPLEKGKTYHSKECEDKVILRQI